MAAHNASLKSTHITTNGHAIVQVGLPLPVTAATAGVVQPPPVQPAGEAGIAAAGGEENITTTDYEDVWFPEGYKGHVSDDVSAGFSPAIYAEFSAPYHARIFKEFGAGGLHNCGPNPCHAAYVAHPLSPRSLDLSDTYSHNDLPRFKQSLRGKAFIYLFHSEGDPVEWYRDIMELMAPDVIVVPVFTLSPQDEPEALTSKLQPIAVEYAKRMEWGWH